MSFERDLDIKRLEPHPWTLAGSNPKIALVYREDPSMNIRVQTASGSTYLFKEKEMTWFRRNVNAGHEQILGLFQNSGKLLRWPTFNIGERLAFEIYLEGGDTDVIRTTRVVLIADVGESAVW